MQDVHRRSLLKLLAGGAVASAALTAGPAFATLPNHRKLTTAAKSLRLYNMHTGERTKVTYWEKGQYLDDSLQELNAIMGDHRSGDVTEMDPKLFDALYNLNRKLSNTKEINIISAYRSPATNAMLRERSNGVAKQSYHTKGMAIDINIDGINLKNIRNAALSLKCGGVGMYGKSDFVHVDTGPVRKWG